MALRRVRHIRPFICTLSWPSSMPAWPSSTPLVPVLHELPLSCSCTSRAPLAPALHELPFACTYTTLQSDFMGRTKGTKGNKKTEVQDAGKTKKGYDAKISIPVRLLVDNWEERIIADNLSKGSYEQPWDPYWLVKNMLGELMDNMLSNWATARHPTQTLRATLPNMEATLNSLENTLSWDSYAPTRHLRHDSRPRSSAHGTTPSVVRTFVPLGNLATPYDKDLNTPTGIVLVPPRGNVQDFQKGKEKAQPSFPVPSTLGPILAKRTCNKEDNNALVCRKTAALPVKLPARDIQPPVKETLLAAKDTLPPARDVEDDACYSCPILEETPSDAEAPSTPY